MAGGPAGSDRWSRHENESPGLVTDEPTLHTCDASARRRCDEAAK